MSVAEAYDRVDAIDVGITTSELLKRTAIIIPTLNASTFFDKLLPVLKVQGLDESQILVVDSSSSDNTTEHACEFGPRLKVIDRRSFNHGGTRRYAVSLVTDFDILVFMTQDAILTSSGAVGSPVQHSRIQQSGLRMDVSCRDLKPKASSAMRTCAKYLAYLIGLREASLPLFMKRKLSMHSFFWQ